MSNQQAQNFALATSNDISSAIWKTTRLMKAAGYRYKASSDGTTKETTGSPAADKWGAGVQVGSQTGSAALTIGAPTSTSFGGRSTVSGMTGGAFSSSSVGNFLTITGASNGGNNGTFLIVGFVSVTSVIVENPSAVSETTGGGATWKEVSALLDTFPALGAGAWWCAQGPSTIRVPIGTTSPTGTFIRGENVTQATSGAQGEILGVLVDTTNGGYLVISPRVSGTGSGPRGWSASAAITGATSGATIAATGTVIEFVREIVFWRSSTTSGHIYYQCIDSVAEATTTATTGRFSVLAALAGATATICPGGASGGSPTTNGFPTVGTFVAGVGTGGTGAVGTGSSNWNNNTNAVNLGLCQLLVANAIEGTGTSADGSISFITGLPTTASTTFAGWGFLRLDDTEDGDVDPYAWCVPNFPTGGFGRSRTGGGTVGTNGDVFQNGVIFNVTSTAFLCHRRRGFPTNDSFTEAFASLIGRYQAGAALALVQESPDRVACSFVSTTVREPMWVTAYGSALNVVSKMRKGTTRWWCVVQGGNGTDTYDGRKWIQLSSTSPAIVIGPADGVTLPQNQ